jgi:predicted CXXCH cytochrome family protein
MRRLNLKHTIGTLAVIVGLAALPVTGWAAITSSSHDFQSSGWNSTGEICVVCHTPHAADTTVVDAPLWNHEVTAATFTPYPSGGTMQAAPGQPDGSSKLCLSCHDGTVALDNFGGATGGTNYVSGATLIDVDLRDDHPVSFTYDATLASNDGQLYDPTTQTSGLGSTIDVDMLFSGKLQCASCHDPHDAGVAKLLVKSNAASDLCLTCHIK